MTFIIATILDSMEQLTPLPPLSNDEDARRAKRAILASMKWEVGGGGGVERGGPYIPFIWSKIAATHRSHYLIYN